MELVKHILGGEITTQCTPTLMHLCCICKTPVFFWSALYSEIKTFKQFFKLFVVLKLTVDEKLQPAAIFHTASFRNLPSNPTG